MSGHSTLLVLFILALLFFALGGTISAQAEIETVKIEMAGCVKYDYENPNHVFKDAAALKAARPGYKNASDCDRIVKNIDFDKYVLLGAQFQNAQCHGFALEHKLVKDDAKKQYRFQVTHPPVKEICAGISYYELWVLAPKLPSGYDTAFEIGERNPPGEQFGKEVPVSPAAGYASRSVTCLNVDTRVYNEESLKKLLSFGQCSQMFQGAKIDFKKQTLIGWQVGGDCHMMVDTNFYRDDKEKLFTLVIKNIWGGCRAGGWRQGMFTVDKIPSDYKVKFVEYLVEDRAGKDSREANDSNAVWTADGQNIPSALLSEPGALATGLPPAKPFSLEIRGIDIYGCISLRFSSHDAVINDNETFQKAVRKDGQEDYCKKNLEKIDFSKNTLLGINLDTGYCREPLGLESKAVRDDEKKQVTLQISYIKPNGLCRALSSYDLWVLVPKIPNGYEVKFEEKAVDRKNDQ
jgi:hypothetical protein